MITRQSLRDRMGDSASRLKVKDEKLGDLDAAKIDLTNAFKNNIKDTKTYQQCLDDGQNLPRRETSSSTKYEIGSSFLGPSGPRRFSEVLKSIKGL